MAIFGHFEPKTAQMLHRVLSVNIGHFGPKKASNATLMSIIGHFPTAQFHLKSVVSTSAYLIWAAFDPSAANYNSSSPARY